MHLVDSLLACLEVLTDHGLSLGLFFSEREHVGLELLGTEAELALQQVVQVLVVLVVELTNKSTSDLRRWSIVLHLFESRFEGLSSRLPAHVSLSVGNLGLFHEHLLSLLMLLLELFCILSLASGLPLGESLCQSVLLLTLFTCKLVGNSGVRSSKVLHQALCQVGVSAGLSLLKLRLQLFLLR